MENKFSRRSFLATSATAAAAVTILPSNVIAGMGHKAPSDKLNIAGVGVGGMGFANLKNLASENIIGLCDVDWKYTGGNGVFDKFPGAKKYKDWRIMYDELANRLMVFWLQLRPHSRHYCIDCYHYGKSVYVQKPLLIRLRITFYLLNWLQNTM